MTILYAIIGIPIFLMVLADFGKLFTRGIKFVWSYVRRLYYTGSLRKVRKTVQVQVRISKDRLYKTTEKSIKWIILFSPVVLKVFLEEKLPI